MNAFYKSLKKNLFSEIILNDCKLALINSIDKLF